MAKKRKTRKQKQLADQRHTFTHSTSYAPAPSLNAATQTFKTPLASETPQISVAAYPYLKKDLSKTAILTLGILMLQILLFMALKNHVFVIPGLSY